MITYYTRKGKFQSDLFENVPLDKLYRLDGPSFIGHSGEQYWVQNGKRHRENGPAIIWKNGDQEWWIKGKLIKTEFSDGYTEYYYNGICGNKFTKIKPQYHRDPQEGPAVIYPDGRVEYWEFGKKIENLSQEKGIVIK